MASGCGTAPPLRETELAPVEVRSKATRAPRPAAAAGTRDDTDVLFLALAAAGADYRWGGKSYQSGFDCSGLVAHVFREAYGLTLPHNSQAQASMGEVIPTADLQPGDLVFFNTQHQAYSHVGIYLGDDRFIHAPKQGAVVRTENLRARYWATRFDGARRIVPSVVTAGYPAPPRKPVVTYP